MASKAKYVRVLSREELIAGGAIPYSGEELYHVGNPVVINSDMQRLAGRVLEVQDKTSANGFHLKDGGLWNWQDWMVEPFSFQPGMQVKMKTMEDLKAYNEGKLSYDGESFVSNMYRHAGKIITLEDSSSGNDGYFDGWHYTPWMIESVVLLREPEVVEVTMTEICAKFGKNVKIVKGGSK